jgi:hypothetical protein
MSTEANFHRETVVQAWREYKLEGKFLLVNGKRFRVSPQRQIVLRALMAAQGGFVSNETFRELLGKPKPIYVRKVISDLKSLIGTKRIKNTKAAGYKLISSHDRDLVGELRETLIRASKLLSAIEKSTNLT